MARSSRSKAQLVAWGSRSSHRINCRSQNEVGGAAPRQHHRRTSMPKHGKKYLEADKKIESDRLYDPDEAVSLLRDIAFANFDETIEVHARLGIDPRQADQTVRATVVLPHGTGRTVR